MAGETVTIKLYTSPSTVNVVSSQGSIPKPFNECTSKGFFVSPFLLNRETIGNAL